MMCYFGATLLIAKKGQWMKKVYCLSLLKKVVLFLIFIHLLKKHKYETSIKKVKTME